MAKWLSVCIAGGSSKSLRESTLTRAAIIVISMLFLFLYVKPSHPTLECPHHGAGSDDSVIAKQGASAERCCGSCA